MTDEEAIAVQATEARDLLLAARRLQSGRGRRRRGVVTHAPGDHGCWRRPARRQRSCSRQRQRCSGCPCGTSEQAPTRRVELAGLLGDQPPAVRLVPDGPLVVLGSPDITDYLGRDVELPPVAALCRCGKSGSQPICDGAHTAAGFDDHKAADRVPDRRDTYRGVAATVLDNRGLCAHSGFCSDRVSSVFHAGTEPFVTPSGGRLDEIIEPYADCPSGALSIAFGDVEARDIVDQPRPPAINISKDGPYRLTGGVAVVDADGRAASSATREGRSSTAACAVAVSRGTSRSAAGCTGTSTFMTRRRPTGRRCSSGPAASLPCCR